jgi:hypothetical protein
MNSFEKSMTEEFLSLESFIIIKKKENGVIIIAYLILVDIDLGLLVTDHY